MGSSSDQATNPVMGQHQQKLVRSLVKKAPQILLRLLSSREGQGKDYTRVQRMLSELLTPREFNDVVSRVETCIVLELCKATGLSPTQATRVAKVNYNTYLHGKGVWRNTSPVRQFVRTVLRESQDYEELLKDTGRIPAR